jgi:hypothetical protein
VVLPPLLLRDRRREVALAMIYYLLPNERTCSECDGETLLLGGGRGARVRARLFLGRVQWRWCPRCGWEGMSRRVTEPPPAADVEAFQIGNRP